MRANLYRFLACELLPSPDDEIDEDWFDFNHEALTLELMRCNQLTTTPASLSIFYTDQYEEMDVKKAAMAPFYIEKNYKGEDNEKEFIKFLEESKSISWWYKNGDAGSEFFSISYFNPDENKEKLFYPDWIFKAKDKIWIVDTKKGATAELADTVYKAEALQEWLRGKKGFSGGIIVQDGPNGWMMNSNTKYSYSPSLKGWTALQDLLN